MSQNWSVSEPKLSESQGMYRVTAEVSGQPVWFESTTPLRPAVEAFAGLFFIPSLHARKTLQIESPIDSKWLAATQQLLPTLNEWWGYSLTSPVRAKSVVESPSDDCSLNHGDRSALCFSCGADSFYSLLTHRPTPTDLVFAHGFDIPVDDWHRRNSVAISLEQVCAARNANLHIVRTNLRTHRLFNRVNWGRTHGAGLAALGHLLGDHVSRLIIASSYAHRFAKPWGSSWLLDPHWSSSSVQIEHDDASITRREKLVHLATEPLALEHLQVCWSLKTKSGNCGQCEKCIRTMIAFENVNSLHLCQTLPQTIALPAIIDGMRKLPEHLHTIWRELQELSPHPATRSAIERLLHRSSTQLRWWRRLAG